MNLENFNVVELSQQENVEANGGTLWGEIAYAVGYVCGGVWNALCTLPNPNGANHLRGGTL